MKIDWETVAKSEGYENFNKGKFDSCSELMFHDMFIIQGATIARFLSRIGSKKPYRAVYRELNKYSWYRKKEIEGKIGIYFCKICGILIKNANRNWCSDCHAKVSNTVDDSYI